MRSQKPKQSKTASTEQVGLRLKIDLAKEVRRIAAADERDLTWVITKALELGLPMLRKRQSAV
jgi:hypothetical protein